MAGVGLFTSRGPWHIISYGILTGSEFFQSFVAGLVAFKALTRPQFAQLQKALFPIYFALQTLLPVLLVFTFPADRTAIGMSAAGLQGVLEPAHLWHVFTPLFTTFAGGLLNLVWIGPLTTRVMIERKHQETRDGKKYYDAGPHSTKMQQLNSQFARLHGVSSLLNIVACGTTIWYGFYLGGRMH